MGLSRAVQWVVDLLLSSVCDLFRNKKQQPSLALQHPKSLNLQIEGLKKIRPVALLLILHLFLPLDHSCWISFWGVSNTPLHQAYGLMELPFLIISHFAFLYNTINQEPDWLLILCWGSPPIVIPPPFPDNPIITVCQTKTDGQL